MNQNPFKQSIVARNGEELPTVVRVERHPRDFTTVYNRTLRDANLELAELGLLVRCLTNTSSWRLYARKLAKQSHVSIHTIRRLIKGLINKGYAEYRRVKDERSGRIVRVELVVYELPELRAAEPTPAPVEPAAEAAHTHVSKTSCVDQLELWRATETHVSKTPHVAQASDWQTPLSGKARAKKDLCVKEKNIDDDNNDRPSSSSCASPAELKPARAELVDRLLCLGLHGDTALGFVLNNQPEKLERILGNLQIELERGKRIRSPEGWIAAALKRDDPPLSGRNLVHRAKAVDVRPGPRLPPIDPAIAAKLKSLSASELGELLSRAAASNPRLARFVGRPDAIEINIVRAELIKLLQEGHPGALGQTQAGGCAEEPPC
jgi:DNA-binding MarR family transcriptional regulator